METKREKSVLSTHILFLMEASMNSDPHAKSHKLVTSLIPEFLIPELGQRRVAHQRHAMRSERRQNNCKYWDLHAVGMSMFVDMHQKFTCQNTINQWVAYLAYLRTDNI